jgi:beta-glucosidase
VIRSFPEGFRWGAATASYQIEGAATADGRGPSIWDTFSHTPGKIRNGDTGDVACDHYHRYREDVALMAELGLHDYRFSIAWPRVVPTGSGAVNEAGLDFYSRLVDELLANGIRPVATLYHWDLPQPLQDAGGWLNRDTAARFAEYAGVVARRLGDRVPLFTTLNEPWCAAFLGHASGDHAPGLTDDASALQAAFHLLLAHGFGLQALRAELGDAAALSITLNPANVRAASDSEADREAAFRAELLANQIFLDPLLRASLPAPLVERTADLTDWSFVRDGDLAVIGAPIDVLGINYYFPQRVGAAPPTGGERALWAGAHDIWHHPQDPPHTGMGWRVEPASMTELLVDLHRDYAGVPFLITENGAAYPDVVDADDVVHDVERCAYLARHISAVRDAIDAGVDIRGYYVWSLLDNFEWAWGYSQRFGIVHVDVDGDLRRRPKDSFELYRRVIAANGVPDDLPGRTGA